MSNISVARTLTFEPDANSIRDMEATNAVQFYAGGFLMYSSTTGYAVKAADTSGYLWFGICQRNVLGDTTASPVPKVQVTCGPGILRNYAVTGASAVTDQGDLVYATDDSVLTLTPTSNTKAVGEVARWITGTTCDVRLYAPEVSRALN